MWRSWLAYTAEGREVTDPNPVIPTIDNRLRLIENILYYRLSRPTPVLTCLYPGGYPHTTTTVIDKYWVTSI